MEARSPRMSLLRAMADSDYFDVVALAPRRELFAPLCASLYPDMIIVDETAAAGDVDALAAQISQGRRVIPVLVQSGQGVSVVGSDTTTITVKQLNRSDAKTRNDVQTALFAAATPIFTAKRTLLGDELEQHAALLREQTQSGNIRREVMSIVSWPLDLILVVDDGSNMTRLAELVRDVQSLPVPVMLAFEWSLGDGYVELSNVAPTLIKRLTEPTSVRHMSGVYIVPPTHQVQIWNENVHVTPGERNVEYTLGSMAWLKSGGLSIVLSSNKEQRATTLSQVAAHGGLVAMLDPAYCEQAEAGRAAAGSDSPPLMLAPDELRWLFSYALPRKG